MKVKAICEGNCGREDMMSMSMMRPDGWYLITIEGPADSLNLRINKSDRTYCPTCYAKIVFPPAVPTQAIMLGEVI